MPESSMQLMKDAIENYVIVKSKCYGYFKNDNKDYCIAGNFRREIFGNFGKTIP